MNSSTQAEQNKPNLCRITLVGPASRNEKRNLLRLKPWSRTEWRKLILEVRVGSDRWPTWDSANICMCAIKDLVKMSDGLLSDQVVTALQTHVDVVSYETFRGPMS